MRRSIWVHQFSQQAEATPAEYAATLLPRGITGVYVKAMDGINWMGDFYSHPMAPRSRSQFHDLVAEFLALDLELIPWVVPRRAATEADAHIEAAVWGSLIIDWEYHYAGFWEGTLDQAQGYHDKLRAYRADEGYWVASAPDPRQPGRDYPVDLIRGLSAYLPQTYWTDFQRPWQTVMESAQAALQDLAMQPILPANGAPGEVVAANEWCAGQGIEAVSLWRMGTATAAQLDAFAQKVPSEEPEEPDMDCGPFKAAIEKATNRLELELAKKTSKGKPAALSRPIVKEISSELFQALQSQG